MSVEGRMRGARLVLQQLMHGPLSWGELERRMLPACGTHWKFAAVMRWLTDEGYIVKEGPLGSRAPYRFNPERVRYEDGAVIIKIG
jgi:hypothetical protein